MAGERGGRGSGTPEDFRGQEETPIHNVEAEAALLGALMIDNRMVAHVVPIVRAEDFWLPVHGRIYEIICYLVGEGDNANPITVKTYVQVHPGIKDLGGAGHYLANLTGSGAALIGCIDFAKQVRDLAQFRKIQLTLKDGMSALGDMDVDSHPQKLVDEIVANLAEDTAHSTVNQAVSAADAMREVNERIAEIQTKGAGMLGATCFSIPEINYHLTRLAPGTMTIIGGRPSSGKSVLGQTVSWGCAQAGHPTALISAEMTKIFLHMRLAADMAFAYGQKINYSDITSGRPSAAAAAFLRSMPDRLADLPLDLLSPDRPTIEEVEGIVARLVQKWKRQGRKLEVVVVDYIQILGTIRRLDRLEKINYISERLIAIAKRHELAIIVLSQLNRDVEKRADKRPMLSDLKESGRLEEDADNVILVHREEYYMLPNRPEETSDKFAAWRELWEPVRDQMDMTFAKVRQGETGNAKVKFFGRYQAVRTKSYNEYTSRGLFLEEEDDLFH